MDAPRTIQEVKAMTKEEYRDKAWLTYSGQYGNGALINLIKAAFDNGFDAACEYYRKKVLEVE